MSAGAPIPTTRDAKPPSTTIAYEQEIRLAVVMYGGVSLAIYINGVAQELLRLVRATARKEPGSDQPLFAEEKLDQVERLYRELGCLLTPGKSRGASDATTRSIRTRFVVDVISGTSAGGINGIFLACALARHQDMKELKELWVTEGELDKLLNDAASVGDLDGRLEVPKQPKSLLNSRRMYIKLLEALEGMRDSGGLREHDQSALVDELDLFVTATDLKGLVVKLRLADRIVYERRYRNVFHFVHATDHGTGSRRNDFRRGNNPFLAYAARCTSSFPAAFEPMTLDQAKKDLGSTGNDPEVRNAIPEWPNFYRDYRDPGEIAGREADPSPGPFGERPFGDGGYLDNKPFGPAISALRQRRADLPVRRMLFYVEPSPEHPELDVEQYEPPDALENLLLASSLLPRQETIREDLERLLERNRQIEYVNRAIRYVGQDFRLPYDDPGKDRKENRWGAKWLSEVIDKPPAEGLPKYGGAYGAYHRLKVSEVTSEMADLIARVVGLDSDSDEVTAVRFLLSAWRQYRYLPEKDDRQPEAKPENTFLMEFDLSYRLRRLRFVMDRLQLLVSDDRRADEILKITEGVRPDAAGKAAGSESAGLWAGVSEKEQREARAELQKLRGQLAEVQTQLRVAGRSLRRPAKENPELADVPNLGIGWEQIKEILNARDPGARIRVARGILGIADHGLPPLLPLNLVGKVDAVAGVISESLEKAFSAASERVAEILHPAEEPGFPKDPYRRVRLCLWHQYRRFDYFDMMLFPMLAGTDLGELRPVEVLRISPEDGTRLVEERDPSTHRLKCPKLAGTRLGNFGAFLDPSWRRSDILWGRLDAAERIVRALAPPPGKADGVKDEPSEEAERILAHLQSEIVRDEIVPLGPEEGRKVFVEALLHTRNRAPDFDALTRMLDSVLATTKDPALEVILERSEVRDAYARRFRENRGLEPEKQVRLAARGTQVFGRLLDGLAERYALIRKRIAWWIITSGRLLNGLVEIAIPRSVWELFGIYWLNLVYGLAAVMAIGGQLMPAPHHVRDFGLVLLIAAYAADLGRRLVRLFLQKHTWWAAAWILGVIALVVFFIGAARTGELVRTAVWQIDANPRPWLVTLAAVIAFLIFVAFSRWVDESLKKRGARSQTRKAPTRKQAPR